MVSRLHFYEYIMRYDDIIIRSAEMNYATPLLVMSVDMISLIYNRFERLRHECSLFPLLSDTLSLSIFACCIPLLNIGCFLYIDVCNEL